MLDESSLLGGRFMFDEDHKISKQRQLQVRTPYLKNGTFGVKCVGIRACYNIDESKVGCGPCYGTYSCQHDDFD
jgi:hypothetical protein